MKVLFVKIPYNKQRLLTPALSRLRSRVGRYVAMELL